jgi:hypothetical protein
LAFLACLLYSWAPLLSPAGSIVKKYCKKIGPSFSCLRFPGEPSRDGRPFWDWPKDTTNAGRLMTLAWKTTIFKPSTRAWTLLYAGIESCETESVYF